MSTTTEKLEKKTKGMCIATRCTSVEQFIQMFHRFVDEESFFVSTLNTRPPGLETSFSVQLADGTPVLRGLCVVLQAWTDANNPFKTPGVRLGIKRLTANSMAVFERLLVTRSATKPPPFAATPAATNGAPQSIVPVATKPGGVPAPKLPAPSSLAVVVAVPKSIPKSPFAETAPTKSAPSRLELKTPVRPSSEPGKVRPPIATPPSGTPIGTSEPVVAKSETPEPAKLQPSSLLAKRDPESRDSAPELTPTPIPDPIPPETTDINDGPTDVREPRKMVHELAAIDTLRAVETPAQIAAEPDLPKPLPDDSRTPGSELVLPANPLMNMSDESLAGYVECTLYEETGNFYPVDDPDAPLTDDVAPPPPLRTQAQTPAPFEGEPPAPTVTPLPPAPMVPAEDFNDPVSVAPPYQTQPKANAYETDPKASAYDPPGTEPQRASSPSIVVPPSVPSPAMPKQSVLVDPALIARGSMPAFDKPGDTKLPAGLPLPAPHRANDRLATARKAGVPWLMFGAIAVLAAAGALVIVLMSSSKGDAEPPRTKPPIKDLAKVTPTPDKLAATQSEPDEAEDPAPGEGPPIVGAGPCSVVVNTTPAGSIVELDDVKLGPSPITVATTCATHKLDISHARYQSATKQVSLSEGKAQAVEITLQRPTHIVTVTSNPPGATIFIDGRRAGTTPTKLSVLGFVTVKLELKKTGFAPAQAKLYSRVPQDQVAVRLTKW